MSDKSTGCRNIDTLSFDLRSRYSFLIVSAQNVLQSLGIEVPDINEYQVFKSTKTLGQCITKRAGDYSWDSTVYSNIALNEVLLDPRYSTDSAVGTAIHELIHALYPLDGHTGRWKQTADYVTSHTKYTITRIETLSDEAYNLLYEDSQYKLVCRHCGQVMYETRRTKLVKDFCHCCHNCSDGKHGYLDLYIRDKDGSYTKIEVKYAAGCGGSIAGWLTSNTLEEAEKAKEAETVPAGWNPRLITPPSVRAYMTAASTAKPADEYTPKLIDGRKSDAGVQLGFDFSTD